MWPMDLHQVAEKIREQFPKIDELILNTKEIFLKVPSDLFKTEAPGLSLPPSPILTIN